MEIRLFFAFASSRQLSSPSSSVASSRSRRGDLDRDAETGLPRELDRECDRDTRKLESATFVVVIGSVCRCCCRCCCWCCCWCWSRCMRGRLVRRVARFSIVSVLGLVDCENWNELVGRDSGSGVDGDFGRPRMLSLPSSSSSSCTSTISIFLSFSPLSFDGVSPIGYLST